MLKAKTTKQQNKHQNNSGFTLIELLVVVLIIGILSGVLISVINPRGIQSKARDADRVADLKQIQTALELYFADNRQYPVSATTGDWERVTSGSSITTSLEAGFINKVPEDPVGGSSNSDPCGNPDSYRYNYRTDATGGIYVLTAIVEVSTSDDDSQCVDANNWSTLGCGASFDTSEVCYAVENP